MSDKRKLIIASLGLVIFIIKLILNIYDFSQSSYRSYVGLTINLITISAFIYIIYSVKKKKNSQ